MVKPADQIKLRSPWFLAWWGLGLGWISIGVVMLPTRSGGQWVSPDGPGADIDWFGAGLGIAVILTGFLFFVFAPTAVKVANGMIIYRWGFKRHRIDLRDVTAIEVTARPGAVFDAVAPTLMVGSETEPLSGLAGYPRSGGKNRRVERQATLLKHAWVEARRGT